MPAPLLTSGHTEPPVERGVVCERRDGHVVPQRAHVPRRSTRVAAPRALDTMRVCPGTETILWVEERLAPASQLEKAEGKGSSSLYERERAVLPAVCPQMAAGAKWRPLKGAGWACGTQDPSAGPREGGEWSGRARWKPSSVPGEGPVQRSPRLLRRPQVHSGGTGGPAIVRPPAGRGARGAHLGNQSWPRPADPCPLPYPFSIPQ